LPVHDHLSIGKSGAVAEHVNFVLLAMARFGKGVTYVVLALFKELIDQAQVITSDRIN
jgi:hypothetical protein